MDGVQVKKEAKKNMKHLSRKMAALGIMILVASSSIIVGMGKTVAKTNVISRSSENEQLTPLVPPNKPIHTADGCHVWDTPGDITPYSKGIGKLPYWMTGGIVQTFTVTSTNPYTDMYYKFYWGDSTSTVVGPYNAGQTATATHDYNAVGFFNVTATVMLGALESNPSTKLMVRMYATGDIDADGVYGPGSFGDINPFVAQLTNTKPVWYTLFPDGYWYTGDINNDCFVDFGDINWFVRLLVGG